MRKLSLSLLLLTSALLTAQVSYNANTNVTPYNQPFRQAVNNGYFPGWINEQIADLTGGNQALNIPGVGARAMRVGFNEEIAELFGYDILKGLFRQYQTQGMAEHTMIIGYPVDWHRDETNYCPTQRSAMFKGMYLPIWDGGANGTPYNDENYLAAYTYKMVSLYKDDIRFWEIWNEPGFDVTFSTGWLPPNQPGNWWQNNPNPCDYVLYAPVQHYVRTLRVTYDIIKTLDPDSYVLASGLGYPSFLDAILRNTDNPNGGTVTSEFPLKGGAYFDAVGFHSYPHFDGSVRYWDPALNQMVDARHSDGAADGTIRVWNTYEQVLNAYGYNGTTYPRKIKLITEGNIPRKAFDVGTANESLGGTEVQRNFAMKNVVRLMQAGFAQYDLYQLFENKPLAQATQPYDVMGLYEMPTTIGVTPARTEHAIAYRTISRHLYNTTYDAIRTAALNLPSNVGGAAFRTAANQYVYVLWAKTQTDRSEAASATYSFPSGLNVGTLTRRNWDFDQTGSVSVSPSANITLSSAPIFLSSDTNWPPSVVNNAPKTDLQLSMSASPINPAAGQNYTWSLTVTNTSTVAATNVAIGNFLEFNKQFILDRVNYVSHNAPSGTTYQPLTGSWSVGTLFAGQSKTLTVTTKAVHGGIYKTFAQVVACDQPDVDSAPINGQAIKQPYEDDEAFFIVNNNGFIDTKADMVVEATNYPATAQSGAAIQTNFMVRNNGRVGGPGSTLTIYLSADAQFSANDQFLTFTNVTPLDAFAYKLFNFPITLPTGLTSGTYYLLFHADFGNTVDEADENNVFARPINITGGNTAVCSINAVVSNVVCNNAGTSTNPADDTWTFDLTVTGSNTGTGWVATVAGQTVTEAYGTPKSVSGGLISVGQRIFAVGDNTNTNCTTQVTAVPPAPCSTTNPPGTYCASKGEQPWQEWISEVRIGNATAQVSQKSQYSDFTSKVWTAQNGTSVSLTSQFSWETWDEYWRIWIDLNGDGDFTDASEQVFEALATKPANAVNATKVTTGSLNIPSGTPSANRRMRVAMKRGSFPLPCETFTYGEVEDYTVAVSGGGTPVCSINAVVSNAVCNNAGTSTNPADDTWTFDLTVTGSNTGTGWVATVAGQTVTGTYGTPKSVTGGLISAGQRIFAVGDNQNSSCNTQVTATPPAPCSTTQTCSISAAVTNLQCQSRGTADPNDDFYTYTLTVSGTNTGTHWMRVGGISLGGLYNIPLAITAGFINEGPDVITLADVANPSCSTTITVTPPAPCSDGSGITYCASKGEAPWQEWISEVRVGTAAAQVSQKKQYSDFTSEVWTAQNGTSVSLTTQFSWETWDEYWRIWIDLNGDGDFTDAGEQVFEALATKPANALNATKVTTGSLNIPSGTPSANRRMRVAMKRGSFPLPCETFAQGEVEDYTVAVSGGGTPVCAISAAVQVGACNNNGTLDNSLDDTYSFTVTITGTNTSSAGWQVLGNAGFSGTYGVPRTITGLQISGGALNFTAQDANNSTCATTFSVTPPPACSNGTNPPGSYCDSKGEFPWEDWIGQVKIGSQSRPSGKSQYSDYTGGTALSVTNGQAIELTSAFSWFTYPEYWRIWIDLNKDGDFTDAGEQVYQGISPTVPPAANTTAVRTGTLTIPAGSTGSTRMRVSMKRGAYAGPCETFTNGEVEDYQVSLATALQSGELVYERKATKSVLTNNPTNHWTQIRFEAPTSASATVYVVNQMGKVVEMQRDLSAGTETVDFYVAHLAKGMYFVHVEVEGERGEVHRLVVLE